jgi:predicted PurR-regulated permease PerM
MDKRLELDVKAWTVVKILLCIVGFWLLYNLREIALVFLTAVVIASAVEEGTNWFVRHRWPRIIAVVFIYFVVLIAIAAFSYFVVPPLLSDVADLLNTLPRYSDANFFNSAEFLSFRSAVQGLANGGSFADIATGFSRSLGSSNGGILQTATTIFGGVWSFIIIAVLSFYLSAQRDGVEKFLRLVTPEQHEVYIVRLWKRSQQMIARWIQGQLLLAIMVGLFVYLGLTLLGIRHALLLAFVSAVFELIPVFGPIFAAIPGIALGLVDGGLGKGLIVAALYTIIQQAESNVIYPLVVKKIVGVPPLVVILSLLAGYELGGFLGVLLSVPLAAIGLEAIYDFTKKPARIEKVELIS